MFDLNNNYFYFLFRLIPKPFETIEEVKKREKGMKFAFYSLFLFSALAMTNMMLYHLEGIYFDTPPPFVLIPWEWTWLTSFFLMIPIALLGAILFAGIVQLISRRFGGKGTFEDQFALFLFAYPLSFIILHMVKLIGFIITRESIGGIFLFTFVILGFFITTIVVKIEQNMNWMPTILISILGYGLVAIFSMTYIR